MPDGNYFLPLKFDVSKERFDDVNLEKPTGFRAMVKKVGLPATIVFALALGGYTAIINLEATF